MPKWTDLPTGITKESSFKLHSVEDVDPSLTDESNLKKLQEEWSSLEVTIRDFAADRGWLGSYNETTLRLSLMAETGELAACVQWAKDSSNLNHLSAEKWNNLCEELADIAIYGFHYVRTISGLNVKGFIIPLIN